MQVHVRVQGRDGVSNGRMDVVTVEPVELESQRAREVLGSKGVQKTFTDGMDEDSRAVHTRGEKWISPSVTCNVVLTLFCLKSHTQSHLVPLHC